MKTLKKKVQGNITSGPLTVTLLVVIGEKALPEHK